MDFDVLVVGAGIHGAAVARELSAKNLRVLVIEKSGQVASATSSKSSKLIHGGLRYLESFQFALVHECLHEQARLLRSAPHLVHKSDFAIPVYRQSLRSPWTIASGLLLYWLMGASFPRRLATKDAIIDGLNQRDLQHFFSYVDAQTDDAHLTRSVLASAGMMGAQLSLETELLGAEFFGNSVKVVLSQQQQRKEYEVGALINAAGPWVSEVSRRIAPENPEPPADLVRGTHIELPGSLSRCYYLEAEDGRAVFALPWREHKLIGTTEVVHSSGPEHCVPSIEEIKYLLGVYNRYFNEQMSENNVLAQWAGLRVLPATSHSYFSRPRDAHLYADRQKKPRYVSIYGGKLTSHAATARRVAKMLKYLSAGKHQTVVDIRRQYLPIVT